MLMLVFVLFVGSGEGIPEAAGTEVPDFAALTSRFVEQTIADRRWLHEYPELSGREVRTQQYLRERLEAIAGVSLVEGEWGTGLVALIEGSLPGPVVAWRADIDALPITETTGLPFSSTCRDTLSGGRDVGVMHACGHDIHMSVALGAVRNLAAVRERLPGTALFLFQPAEETGDGSQLMLDAGVFDGPRRPKCVLALHDHPSIEIGKVGSCPGWSTANVDGFKLTMKGKGGHGAYPHRSIDPVNLAAQMVLACDRIVSRQIDVNRAAVITVGSIHGGTKSNVIPSEVVLEATVRTRDEATRQKVKNLIEQHAQAIALTAGAPEPVYEYSFGTPGGYNDPALVAEVREVFRRILGPENEFQYEPGMGGEDFSRFGKVVPGFQFRLGVAPPGVEMSLHRANFNPDERSVELGMRLVAEIIWDQLARGD